MSKKKTDPFGEKLMCLEDHYAARQFWKKGDHAIRGQLGDQYFPKRWKKLKTEE